MFNAEFRHISVRQANGVAVIDMVTKDIQGPEMSKEFINELMAVVEQDEKMPIILNLRRAGHFGSMGYAGLFKLVKYAKERGRPVRFCSMHEDVRVGGDIVGLPLVVEIDDDEQSALKALATS